jgi:hypothetical protein
MVVWLRETLDAAQRDAETAAKDTDPEWSDGGPHGESVHALPHGDPVAVDPWGYMSDGVRAHIARHDPAAVLRRIKKDREILDDCDDVLHDFVFGAFRQLALDTICRLAEGWGWTEENADA